MGSLWLRIKIWIKVTLFVAVLVYVIFFVAENSATKVRTWFWFSHKPETTVLKLVLIAFAAGAVCAILVRTTFVTIRQIRELQERTRASRLDREMADMRTKAAMLRAKPDAAPAPPPPAAPQEPLQ